MKIYDYRNLLKEVMEIKTNKIIAENERVLNKKEKLLKMENEIKASGILDDWYDLKRICRELDIRIMPYGGWDETKHGALMEDYNYFDDNGMFLVCMSSGSYWSDYFGFSYKDREFKWKFCHTTNTILFNEFKSEDKEIDTKIMLIELFMKRYEEYRDIQLQRIYAKMGETMEEIIEIKKYK